MSTDTPENNNFTAQWETQCLQLRQNLRKCSVLQRRLRVALQSLKNSPQHMTEDEADAFCSMLTTLAGQLAELIEPPGAEPNRDGVRPALMQRGQSLAARFAKLQLITCYLGHQLANVAIRSLATAKPECREALAVGVCMLARELHGCSVAPATEQLLLYRSTCPVLLVPVRRLTLTRLLQLCAAHRAEHASCEMLAALIPYAPPALKKRCSEDREQRSLNTSPEHGRCPKEASSDGNESCSSMEVARELLRYASPPRGVGVALSACIATEQQLPACILAAVREHAPQLAGPSGATLLAQRESRAKVLTYYRQLLWGDAGTLADHVLLWWSRPLGALWSGHGVLRWLRRIRGEAGTAAGSAVAALCEALAAHHASVSWDALFRRALVAPSGPHFASVLTSLVRQLSTGAAAVEQIPLLHRLDHSLHTYRLWVLAAARHHVGAWRLRQFVDISQRDVAAVVLELRRFTLSETEISPPIECVHETVCIRMRCKLVSEVKTNLTKLESAPEECIKVMAAVCRTISLANLHMCFPDRQYWREDGPLPQFASTYVEQYLERVLRPVLIAVASRPIESQQQICGMALRIVCEAWLDHIYELRVHFSEWGALQLLADFGAVPTWLQERAVLAPAVERSLVRSEVLRRCEGVGRLLLRRPGEALQLHDATSSRRRAQEDGSGAGTPVKDSMPAEMYVPNQEKWLELRARRRGAAGVAAAAALLCCR